MSASTPCASLSDVRFELLTPVSATVHTSRDRFCYSALKEGVMRFIGLSALVAIAVLSARADADPATIWSMNAASCTPAQAAGTSYSISGGAVTNLVAHGQYFYCPISSSLRQLNGTTNTITLYYSGQSNYGCISLCQQAHWVEVQLVAMSRTTGAETTVVTLGSTAAASFASVSSGFSYAFDFDANVYYVRIRAEGTTTWPENIYAVTLKDS
jgi:hypothetical protein